MTVERAKALHKEEAFDEILIPEEQVVVAELVDEGRPGLLRDLLDHEGIFDIVNTGALFAAVMLISLAFATPRRVYLDGMPGRAPAPGGVGASSTFPACTRSSRSRGSSATRCPRVACRT